ncbi:MAG: helix-turn-helix domain-containing protein [Bacteroidota bacterium]|nr:helix-turn-helix domain-containing protein [Bacteroidota bacterium]
MNVIFRRLWEPRPSSFCGLSDFQHAIHYKGLDPQSKLTGLAYDCGFSDQSHMINEFRELSGVTPKQYFAECDPFSDYFSE